MGFTTVYAREEDFMILARSVNVDYVENTVVGTMLGIAELAPLSLSTNSVKTNTKSDIPLPSIITSQ